MIWYAFEILWLLIALFGAFLLYRVLVNSTRFTRFIERTKGTDDLEDAAARLDIAEEAADEAVVEYETHSERQRRNLEELKRRRRA